VCDNGSDATLNRTGLVLGTGILVPEADLTKDYSMGGVPSPHDITEFRTEKETSEKLYRILRIDPPFTSLTSTCIKWRSGNTAEVLMTLCKRTQFVETLVYSIIVFLSHLMISWLDALTT
jgi:hypothetical protein